MVSKNVKMDLEPKYKTSLCGLSLSMMEVVDLIKVMTLSEVIMFIELNILMVQDHSLLTTPTPSGQINTNYMC